MATEEADFVAKRVADTYDRVSGWTQTPQRFALHTELFWELYQPQGAWRATNVTRIPIIDQHRPDAGVRWIDARLFSDGYLRGNVRARSGEIHCIAVDVSTVLGTQH